MFIANKTINVIKTVGIILLVTLLAIIAAQSVLYIKTVHDNNIKLSNLQLQLDSLKVSSETFTTSAAHKQTNTDNNLSSVKSTVDSLATILLKVETLTHENATFTEILIVNECQVTPYYMDKRLREMCKSKDN